jgi:hypothetical protein
MRSPKMSSTAGIHGHKTKSEKIVLSKSHRLGVPRLTALRFASPSEPNAAELTPFPPMRPSFFASEEKALPTGMLNRRIHPPLDFSRSCGRGRLASGFSSYRAIVHAGHWQSGRCTSWIARCTTGLAGAEAPGGSRLVVLYE